MNWAEFERALDDAFTTVKLTVTDGRVFGPARGFNLRRLLKRAATTEDERDEIDEDPWDLLARRYRVRTLVAWEWESGGPMSWSAELGLLPVGRPRDYLCVYQESWGEDGDARRLVAALEPKESREVYSGFFRSLIERNGARYGIDDLFGSLPSSTRNRRPDLMAGDAIKESYWGWMGWASRKGHASWVDLRDSVLRRALDPSPLVDLGALVKRQFLASNPVAALDRPPHRREAPRQVPGPELMDALVEAAKQRRQPRDVALFLVLRYTGLRRESVARLQVQHLDPRWGLRGIRVKGGKAMDVPLPSIVIEFLAAYIERVLAKQVDRVRPDTPLFWSRWGRRSEGLVRAPMTGKNIWRLVRTYGRMIGCPELKPHDLRHGVAMELLEQQLDLEQVRALLGHARIDTTQIYTEIRPIQLKRAVSFYEAKARTMLGE